MNGKVWLVGAGPSDISLLTVKGRQVLEQAEVVIYDQLVDLSILLCIPEGAEAIDAGKHAGNHTLTQDKTNALLVEKAREGKRVVRLKGGDPFVFGRGGEEIEELVKAGIPYEVVPGVPSPVAVPAYAGIPVTHRDYTPSFHVITAHRKRGSKEGINFKELAALGDVTLVFLMGIGALKTICEGLMEAGVSEKKAAAVIQNGARYNERKVVGTLADLPKKALQAGIGTPGIIVVGDVCELEQKFSWAKKRPLGTKRVIVTRPKDKKDALAKLLREEGAAVLELPVTRIVEKKENNLVSLLKKPGNGYDWIAFTSETGVELFFKTLREQQIDVRTLMHAKMAVIGEVTREALLRHGFVADLMPQSHYGDALARELQKQLQEKSRILLIVPENKKSSCKEALEKGQEEYGYRLDTAALYRTEFATPRFFDWKKDDIVTFASSSAVDGFARNLEKDQLLQVQAVCIGAHTMATAASYGMQAVRADDTTMKSLAQKVTTLIP